MLKQFFPGEYLDSIYQIDFEALFQEGYRGLLFDVDNTLVPHGAPADKEIITLFQKLHELGFQTRLLSNNKEPRVRSFCEQVGGTYCYKAGKPSPKSYIEGMKTLQTSQKNTIFIGDQIFTDIWGANKAGIRTILVRPIHPKEEIQIILKRIPEKLILHFYRKHRLRGGDCK